MSFPGPARRATYICDRMVHKCHRRFLPAASTLRKKTNGVYNQLLPFFTSSELRDPILPLTYAGYLQFADAFVENGQKLAVSGCKEPWCFRELPYAASIVTVTDPMHIFGNVIGDSILLLRPGNSIKANRSATPSIIQYEQQTNKRFIQGFLNFKIAPFKIYSNISTCRAYMGFLSG